VIGPRWANTGNLPRLHDEQDMVHHELVTALDVLVAQGDGPGALAAYRKGPTSAGGHGGGHEQLRSSSEFNAHRRSPGVLLLDDITADMCKLRHVGPAVAIR
jgi:hypothetical protein